MILIRSIAMTSAALLLAACGAPAKKASEVPHIFEKPTLSLQSKVNDLCQNLQTRTEAPSVKVLKEGSLNCEQAGESAQNFSRIDRFSFVGVDSNFRPSKRSGDVSFVEVRSEVWLNRNLLNLASKLGEVLKKGVGSGEVTFRSNANDKFADLVKPRVEVIEQTPFNQEAQEFGMKLRFILDGIVKADHIIDIRGKIIDNAIAVTAATTQDQVLKKSILQNFQAVFLIVPHASDVYLDLNVKMNVHDIGVSDSMMKDNVHSALSSGMKAAIDSLMGLNT